MVFERQLEKDKSVFHFPFRTTKGRSEEEFIRRLVVALGLAVRWFSCVCVWMGRLTRIVQTNRCADCCDYMTIRTMYIE